MSPPGSYLVILRQRQWDFPSVLSNAELAQNLIEGNAWSRIVQSSLDGLTLCFNLRLIIQWRRQQRQFHRIDQRTENLAG
jgi:hypothetical protein